MQKVGCLIIKLLVAMILIVAGIVTMCLYRSLDRKIWSTYYGGVNLDTLEVEFNDFNDGEPCYKVHSEVIDNDTTDFYFYPWKGIYYKSVVDSTGKKGYVIYDPYTDNSLDYIHYK